MSIESQTAKPDQKPRVEFRDHELLEIAKYAVDPAKVYRVRCFDPMKWIEIRGDRLMLVADAIVSMFTFMRGCASQSPPKGDGVLDIVRHFPVLEYPCPGDMEPMFDGSEEFIKF
jgi:hypothetical protein